MHQSKVVILGNGNLGGHLVKKLYEVGVSVLQVYDRSYKSENHSQYLSELKYISEIEDLSKEADVYILCISDDAIYSLSKKMALLLPSEKIIAHTSGSLSSKEIDPHFVNSGCFYPLQTFHKNRSADFHSIPILIDGTSVKAKSSLFNLASRISERVVNFPESEKSKLHVPAVLINNFPNHLYTMAYEYCQKEGLDFTLLLPLLKETANRVNGTDHPSELQTGPARRSDVGTIRRHLSQLRSFPHIKKAYSALSSTIKSYYAHRS